jgi:hypothetical protein
LFHGENLLDANEKQKDTTLGTKKILYRHYPIFIGKWQEGKTDRTEKTCYTENQTRKQRKGKKRGNAA